MRCVFTSLLSSASRSALACRASASIPSGRRPGPVCSIAPSPPSAVRGCSWKSWRRFWKTLEGRDSGVTQCGEAAMDTARHRCGGLADWRVGGAGGVVSPAVEEEEGGVGSARAALRFVQGMAVGPTDGWILFRPWGNAFQPTA